MPMLQCIVLRIWVKTNINFINLVYFDYFEALSNEKGSLKTVF